MRKLKEDIIIAMILKERYEFWSKFFKTQSEKDKKSLYKCVFSEIITLDNCISKCNEISRNFEDVEVTLTKKDFIDFFTRNYENFVNVGKGAYKPFGFSNSCIESEDAFNNELKRLVIEQPYTKTTLENSNISIKEI